MEDEEEVDEDVDHSSLALCQSCVDVTAGDLSVTGYTRLLRSVWEFISPLRRSRSRLRGMFSFWEAETLSVDSSLAEGQECLF